MKKVNVFLAMATLVILVALSGCEQENLDVFGEDSILPENFRVDIPNSLTNSGVRTKSTAVDTLNGNAIYANLTTFIAIGDGASEIVEDIMLAIAIYRINKPMSITFTGDDDKRDKNLVVVESSSFEGELYDYQLTITDAESESNADGGKAIQVFWNLNPIEGVAILKPYNIDRKENPEPLDAMFRIDYSQAPYNDYEAHMIVTIEGLPLDNPLVNPFSVDNMKMFVGKKGDIIDVYGNTNHPNATFFSDETGFNWAFVASGDEYKDVAVAELGLPPSGLDASSRKILLEDYSIKEVFSNEIYSLWPWIDEQTVDSYLHNTEAPGYFNDHGFIQGGTSPGSDWDEAASRIDDLTPYNPKDIDNLVLEFK